MNEIEMSIINVFTRKSWNWNIGKTPHTITLNYFSIWMIVILILFSFSTTQAASNKFSKDYKAYPPGTPEDVVTKFIEYADLGKDANRQADERFPLFWPLTEKSEVPENSQRLIIKSYKISGKKELPSGDVIVGLKLDVRALALSSCDPQADNNYKLQRNNCQWRDRVVVIHDIVHIIRYGYLIMKTHNRSNENVFLNPIKYKNAISKIMVFTQFQSQVGSGNLILTLV